MSKRKVILVTDGDMVAKAAVEIATSNIGGRCISFSAGNPTVLTGHEIVELIKAAEKDPVVVMVDDRGRKGMGPGEAAMESILNNKDIEVIGVVAVSSDGKDCNGIKLTCSITREGKVIKGSVDKNGVKTRNGKICGDTLSILRGREDLVIVGIGDPGKMNFYDSIEKGAPITTKALEEIVKRSTVRH
ncbi:stage V sporulation protein AE [Acetivibrio straminisolvens]|uniref:Stage V sporulation protein AE n=1 Tax=Acetivibrio straminisolvens JCM 21531 TaxID=1294263 RepID=W4V4Q6_9FIRM|nr:stage V sporulation protein AE [Acetivibrio straminisolvens]GAE88137.1 stage V sporulation protein AE [Acetivibrio straminisolvens JCM 21531]